MMNGLCLIVIGLMLIGCTSTADRHADDTAISHYTCPMHPQIRADRPGDCPICHMRLVPVRTDGEAKGTKGEPGTPVVTISHERQQLIGVVTAAAQKKALRKRVRTVGRVAFDPELAIAQREYVEIASGVPELEAAARSRLRLLGMDDTEIQALQRTKRADRSLYLPRASDGIWIYATIYAHELPLIKKGMSATISLPADKRQSFVGTVRAIDPVLDPMTRSARARIELPKAGGRLLPEMFVDVVFETEIEEAVVIPTSAVVATGTRTLAFVVHDGTRFEAREISLGMEGDDDVAVLSGMREGESVVVRGTFLVDSESQLKSAISGMGEHRH